MPDVYEEKVLIPHEDDVCDNHSTFDSTKSSVTLEPPPADDSQRNGAIFISEPNLKFVAEDFCQKCRYWNIRQKIQSLYFFNFSLATVKKTYPPKRYSGQIRTRRRRAGSEYKHSNRKSRYF